MIDLTGTIVDQLDLGPLANVVTALLALDVWTSDTEKTFATTFNTDAPGRRNLLKTLCGPLQTRIEASMDLHRDNGWAAWVRADVVTRGAYVIGRLSATIGDERVLACPGCGRITAINALTADHVLPKSQSDTLFTWIRGQDNVSNDQWRLVRGIKNLNANRVNTALDRGPTTVNITYTPPGLAQVADTTDLKVLVAFAAVYSNPLRTPDDTRNFVAMCPPCNTNKNDNGGVAPPLADGGWTAAVR